MDFPYKEMETLRRFGLNRKMPEFIPENLNPNFELRPYQIAAFENYVTWFESDTRPHPVQNLFHMATGSGKTLIMAGLILYLYEKGYRNFLFFVNLTNIVQKTKENFLNSLSSKYLFAREIRIGGERVPVKEVPNFQCSDDSAINLCFTTTQGLHMDLLTARENGVSLEDFADQKVVFISDEAHHLNADTKMREKNKDEELSYRSWESTVRRIFRARKDNVLLEFTATCELSNPYIQKEYEDKIIFDYSLAKFRADGYSKEIKTLRCDIDRMERAIQAAVLSQYRLKIFQDHRLSIKPVILFKALTIADSRKFMKQFQDRISRLTGAELKRISSLTDNVTMAGAYRYFAENGITFEQLAQELKEDFGPEHCISVNDDKEAEDRQIALNSLEDADNPYRAVFEVKKLDEGWDVLNLFDIVRLYETRQSGGKKMSPTTISEAQLIGRGARYCPFRIHEDQEKYRRKYDSDLEHPLRICEELYYHCQNESRYINELRDALREIGLGEENTVTCHYVLKEAFKKDPLYREGLIFLNSRIAEPRDQVFGLPASVREKVYRVRFSAGSSGEDTILEDNDRTESMAEYERYAATFAEIAEMNYAVVQRALCRYGVYRFHRLKTYFPNLESTREFIMSGDYLGQIRIEIFSKYQAPPPSLLHEACARVLGMIGGSIASIDETYRGSKVFTPQYIRDVFTDRHCTYKNPPDSSVGTSQKDGSVPETWRLDLSKEDWFAYEDNFGTSEEKAFVAYFATYVKRLKKKYDKVWLVRNERQFHLYSFDEGKGFEPDYVLFLHSPKTGADGQKENGYEQLQVFIEPKGSHLLKLDSWKEEFLLQIKEQAVPKVLLADDNDYRIWGFHFYNEEERLPEFISDLEDLLKDQTET